MTPEEAALALDGQEYNSKFSSSNKVLYAEMESAGIVAVYGESDDLIEFRGAICDEISAYNGTTAYLDRNGLIENECSNADCPHFEHAKKGARTIKALWCADETATWTFETDIPHETFSIWEDGNLFCRGIVFRLDDVS
jgi:hypothetical protein